MPLRFRDNVVTAETEYGAVLLDQRSGDYWELNPTGALVVRTLMRGGEESDAVAALVEEFDVSTPRATQDVSDLLAHLRSSGLVVAR
ncbi:lasso peptide biosynthesis PqqD family chaperone [Streptomyces sp. 6N223]|uniref:lasso peptide biosynthesis PqqD family chaperone n=1 Tax=Streptomyces sp. 6N223 TaxID=3457412 RepID=UPI003FD11937